MENMWTDKAIQRRQCNGRAHFEWNRVCGIFYGWKRKSKFNKERTEKLSLKWSPSEVSFYQTWKRFSLDYFERTKKDVFQRNKNKNSPDERCKYKQQRQVNRALAYVGSVIIYLFLSNSISFHFCFFQCAIAIYAIIRKRTIEERTKESHQTLLKWIKTNGICWCISFYFLVYFLLSKTRNCIPAIVARKKTVFCR